jgi:hypothetical protein
MKNDATREETLAELDLLDSMTLDLLQKLTDFPAEVLNQSPGSGVWSPLQVLSHVLKSETSSLTYVKKKLSFDPQLKKAGIITWFKWILLKVFLYAPLKFKAPKGVATEDLPTMTDLAEFKAAIGEHRKSLRSYLENVDAKRFDQEVYRHPIAGRLSLKQMIKFFTHHLYRHSNQIFKRLPAASLAIFLLSVI